MWLIIFECADPGARGGTQLEVKCLKGYGTIKSLGNTVLEDYLISTEELWSSVRVTLKFLVTSLTKALLPRLLGRAASSRKSLGGSKPLPIKNDGGHWVLGDLQCCSTTSWLGFCSDMHCQL